MTATLSPADRQLADSFAGNVRDLASPEEIEARRARIYAARARNNSRLTEMCEARATLRKHEIRTASEAMGHLNNLLACMADCLTNTHLDSIRARLVELASDVETEIMTGEWPVGQRVREGGMW